MRIAIEIVVLGLIVLAPWPFGGVEPIFEFLLYSGIALVLVLWALRILLERGRGDSSSRAEAESSPVFADYERRVPRAVLLGLIGICLLGVMQLIRLPSPVLAFVSPVTVRWTERLLPAEPEVTAAGRSAAFSHRAAGSQLSFYRAVTRKETIRYLAVASLLAAVACNLASVAALRRLCVVALVNGTLLAGFGLVQFFSSTQDQIYWALSTQGTVFGPFICRNHFAFYLNLCIGLGVGLLLYSAASRPRSARTLLHDSRSLWISAALALMLSSIVFCVSRGGLLALLVASAVCLAVRLATARQFRRSAAVALTVASALALLVYLKFDLLESRLATLWQIDRLAHEGRLDVWRDALRLVPQFPLWGTGHGTFAFVEPLHRSSFDGSQLFWDYAHNDYVQVLVEGGLAGFALAMVALGGVLQGGWRACKRYGDQPASGLVLGGLLAVVAVAVHSFLDFGLHVPAVALLTAVVAAQLAGLGLNAAAGLPQTPNVGRPSKVRAIYRRAVPGLAAALAVLVALVLFSEGWRADRARRHVLVSRGDLAAGDPASAVRQLQAAVNLIPQDAFLHLGLGDACYRLRESSTDEIQRSAWLDRALQHYVQARNLCPLDAEPQLRLAREADRFAKADPRSEYLARAAWLRPFDDEIWYAAGLEAWDRGQYESATPPWRRCLAISDRRLPEILEDAGRVYSAHEVLERLLAVRAEVVYAAAERLPADQVQTRRLYLRRALEFLDQQKPPRQADQWRLASRLHEALGEGDEAVAAYRELVSAAPRDIAGRLQYAELLERQQKLQQARRELLTVLALQPGHRQARTMLETLSRAIAEQEVSETVKR